MNGTAMDTSRKLTAEQESLLARFKYHWMRHEESDKQAAREIFGRLVKNNDDFQIVKAAARDWYLEISEPETTLIM